MVRWVPSDELFVNRLAWLVRRDGLNSVATDYGRSRRSVRRWLSYETRPNQNIRRRIANRGRRITGPAVRTRDARGRFRTAVMDRRARSAIATINRERRERRELGMREARTDRQRQIVAQLPGDLTPVEERDLDRRLQDLVRRDALGEDTADDWREFEADYQSMVGSA